MPTVAAVAAKIAREGQTVRFVRQLPGGPLTAAVTAFVRQFQPSELVGDIQQGDREVRADPASLAEAGWTGAPPHKPDQLLIGTGSATVQNCETVCLRGVPAVYVIHVRGS